MVDAPQDNAPQPQKKRRPGGKPCKDEIRERVQLALELLTRGMKKWQIKRAFKERWSCSARTVERYLGKARAILRSEIGKEDVDHCSESYGFYRSVIANPKATVREKLKAQENIDKLLGLRKPIKVAKTDAAGNDVPDDQIEERRKRVAAALDQLKERAAIAAKNPSPN